MEAPRPVMAAALAALLALALALPAAASAERRVDMETAGELTTFTYRGDDARDDVIVQWDEENAEFFWYRFITTPAPGGCASGTPPSCQYGAEFDTRLVLLGNGGDDRFDVTGLPPDTNDHVGPVRADGGAGADSFVWGPTTDRFAGGPGDDSAGPLGAGDRYDGGTGTDTLDLSPDPGAHAVTLDGTARDWPGTANVGADVERLIGGGGADAFTGNAAAQTLAGGGGDDVLDGGGGADWLDGGAGDDTIRAADRAVDTILCGGGDDTVRADWNDTIVDEEFCEVQTFAPRDDDGDGVPRERDCDDADAAVRPGAGEIPGNGIDEDCSGADAVIDNDGDGASPPADCDDGSAAIRPGAADPHGNGVDEDCSGADGPANDRDADGIGTPADCDDASARVRPGARDRPRNGFDEDCDGADADWRANRAGIVNSWVAFRRFTRVRRLKLRRVPARAKVRVRCKGRGCPFKRKRVRVRRGKASATRLFKRARLRKGALIEVRVTAPATMGKVVRYRIRRGKLPRKRELCLPPGTKRPRRCSG